MKYIANPVEVDAFKIESVMRYGNTAGGIYQKGDIIEAKLEGYLLTLENGEKVTATPEMCSRMVPKKGDYWVIQADGYVYLNPKKVFERKYSAAVCGSDGKWYSVNDKNIPG